MIQLPLKTTKNIFTYTQVKRNDNIALYAQTYDEKHISYEVFIIPKYEDREIAVKLISAHEALPGDNAFGVTAWSTRDFDKAKLRFD